MSAQGRGYTYSYREALTILGNGDAAKGRRLIDDLAGRLVHARTEHPVFANTDESAVTVIDDELWELANAVYTETPERAHDEALDVMATVARFLNDEHK